MKKLLILPNKLTDDILDISDAILVGIEGFSVNIPCNITMNELKNLKNKYDKEIFVSLNKNMRNSDIEKLKEILIEIDKLNIKGILYADTCFINLKKELNIKTDLVWSQEHLTTNYGTINFWSNYGVNYTYLSGEITAHEIEEISKNTNVKLIMPIFGYIPIYVSLRHAVKNYLKTFNLKDDSSINYIENDGNIYPIIDNNLGTTVYSNYILDGYDEFKSLNIDYFTLNEFNIDHDTFIKVIKKYRGEDTNYKLETTKGFLYTNTIYKVK